MAPGQLSFHDTIHKYHYERINADTQVFGVIADPVAHSYSPLLHNSLFQKLGMTQTELRNGVLIYLAIKDHKFAIIGDSGINQLVAADFWNETKETMLSLFKEGKFADGLSKGILMAGEQLKANFPYQSDDVNELSDEISFDKNL